MAETPAKTGADPAGGSTATPPVTTDPPPSKEGAPAGDKGGGKSGDAGDDSRSGERIKDLVSKNKTLEESNDDLKARMEVLEQAAVERQQQTPPPVNVDDNPAIKKLKGMGYTEEQIEAAKAVYEAVSTEKGSDLEKEVKRLQAQVASNEDQQKRIAAIKAYAAKGIEVTEDEIEAQRKEWLNDKDPRTQLMADIPYSKIIGIIKAKEIAAKEVDAAADSTDTSNPPAVPSGKEGGTDKKPSGEGWVYDPGNPRASDVALERKVLAAFEGEEE